jgi:putative alpha-1,2-mannosidase
MGTRPFRLRGALTRAALLMTCAFGASTVPTAAQAQAQPAQAEAQAILLRPLTFFKVDDLNFGDIVPGTTAGQVRLEPDGTRTRTGGVTLAGSTHQPASFAGMGTYNRYVLISMSPATTTVTGPGTPMTVTQFEIGSTPTAILTATPQSFRIAATSGQFIFPVGARLNVNANQAPGVYTGTFTVTLNYL